MQAHVHLILFAATALVTDDLGGLLIIEVNKFTVVHARQVTGSVHVH